MAINWKEWRTKKLELMRDFMSPALKSYSREFTVVVFSVVDRRHVYTSSGWRVGCAGQMPTWHFSFPNKNISILTRKSLQPFLHRKSGLFDYDDDVCLIVAREKSPSRKRDEAKRAMKSAWDGSGVEGRWRHIARSLSEFSILFAPVSPLWMQTFFFPRHHPSFVCFR